MSEHEQGLCPECGDHLEYGTYTMHDDSLCYEVSCETCIWEGTEWYRTEFDNLADTKGNPLPPKG